MTDQRDDPTGGKPLSACAPDVERKVEDILRSLPDIVVLHRLTRAAGAREWYLIRSVGEWREVIAQGRSADSFSLFLRPQLPLRGSIDGSFVDALDRMLEQTEWPKSEVILGEVVGRDTRVRHTEGWGPHERDEMQEWLREHWGRTAVAGLHPELWSGNDEVLTVYVPDPEGEVQPGIY